MSPRRPPAAGDGLDSQKQEDTPLSTIPEIGPAPFAPVDRVIHRPRPAASRLSNWSNTAAKAGAGGTSAPARQSPRPRSRCGVTTALNCSTPQPAPATGRILPGGCRRQLRRLGRAAGGVALVVLVLSVLWGVLVELPS